MEYSTDDIAAARSLQFTKYMHTSMATIWIYGYACSLDEEWAFLLRSHWTKMKGLYIVARFLPLIFCATSLYMDLTPSNDSVDACRMLVNVESGLGLILGDLSECLFILRTYVLWNKNRTLLAAILCSFFVCSQSTRHTQASIRRIDQTLSATTISITLAAVVPKGMHSLLPSLWRSTNTKIFCSLSQVRLARSQESQGATRARPVTSSSYHFFSFLHFNWDS
ncbi:uncharacterized protein F5891DRAFT_1189505 [Suillus fuscotomentosus]|uniref:DUF6533 domain-containing protein n=1 Tax=Suillus fuscotomentosus TaxID=1912939 RepID=A0AAD4HKC2_9AGAM|nr:uncharacterized protein F5891DRAFT_1189505 [Suillus fuscotomentosus]KAG1899697.1 hypothetical protein F5891DRAFT_1189505 [Suillus fuscotomentosus]